MTPQPGKGQGTQLELTTILQAADDDYHAQRAVKPSWLETCESCGGWVWLSEPTDRSICENCKRMTAN